jgi:hypothetical protein
MMDPKREEILPVVQCCDEKGHDDDISGDIEKELEGAVDDLRMRLLELLFVILLEKRVYSRACETRSSSTKKLILRMKDE